MAEFILCKNAAKNNGPSLLEVAAFFAATPCWFHINNTFIIFDDFFSGRWNGDGKLNEWTNWMRINGCAVCRAYEFCNLDTKQVNETLVC